MTLISSAAEEREAGFQGTSPQIQDINPLQPEALLPENPENPLT